MSDPNADTQPPAARRGYVPVSVFERTVSRFEEEIEALRMELREAHHELERAREDLREVLTLLRAQQERSGKFYEHLARICTAFAEDGKVRIVLVGGLVALLLVLAGVGGLSYRDGELTISPAASENRERAISPEPALLP